MTDTTELTVLLNRWRSGDPELIGDIIPAVYDELHRVARSYMRRQSPDHTLQATALINEAFCRLGSVSSELKDRSHFISIVARVMRNVLVDHARAKGSQKRGGNLVKEQLQDTDGAVYAPSVDVLALESVLKNLDERDSRKVRIAELHYFCGATYKETADILDISEATVRRELRMLKAVLAVELADG